MKIRQLFEDAVEEPLILQLLRIEMAKCPTVYIHMRDGRPYPLEIVEISEAPKEYSKNAGPEYVGKTYVVLNTKGEGYVSWARDLHRRTSYGLGHGNLGAPITLDDSTDQEYRLEKLKVDPDQPPMWCFGRRTIMKQYMDNLNANKVRNSLR